MNCKRMEKWILLAGSGELSPDRLERLELHIAGCAGCSAYRRNAAKLVKEAAAALPGGEPAPETIASLKRAAAELLKKQDRRAVFFNIRRRWLAAAAALAIAAAAWMLLDRPRAGEETMVVSEAVSDPFAGGYASLDNGLADIVSISGAPEVMPRMERLSDLSRHPNVSLVDRELMILEGLAI